MGLVIWFGIGVVWGLVVIAYSTWGNIDRDSTERIIGVCYGLLGLFGFFCCEYIMVLGMDEARLCRGSDAAKHLVTIQSVPKVLCSFAFAVLPLCKCRCSSYR